MTVTDLDLFAGRLNCQHCGRPCANGTGKAAHERHCAQRPGALAAEPKVEVVHLRRVDLTGPSFMPTHMWSSGRWGTAVNGKRVGAVDGGGLLTYVGTPNGHVIPRGAR